MWYIRTSHVRSPEYKYTCIFKQSGPMRCGIWPIYHSYGLFVGRIPVVYGLIYNGCQPISIQGSNHPIYNGNYTILCACCHLLCGMETGFPPKTELLKNNPPKNYTVPVKTLDTPTHSRAFHYLFYYFLHCRIIVKTSKLWKNTNGIM